MQIHGIDLTAQLGCKHYHTPLDIVAILFKCCGRYFACYECHEEMAGHMAEKWSSQDFETPAVLCSTCKSALTINEYLSCDSHCLYCDASFNPGCRFHWHLYFIPKLIVACKK